MATKKLPGKTASGFAPMPRAGHEITAKSWSHLHDLLFESAWNDKIQRFRSRSAFRGTSRASYKLEPGLMRIGGEYWQREEHLLRNFKKYAHRSVVERDSFWHWISLAQHHGLPTRLLDWTYSPLVALHFATSNIAEFDHDGCVWEVDYDEIHTHLPNKLEDELKRAGAFIFTVDMLDAVVPSLQALDSMRTKTSDFVLFFEPPSIDDRIVNQFAYFSVASSPTVVLDDWLTSSKANVAWKKIIIPAALKWEVRDKLDQANVSERVIFPGLDGLSQWLKRHYTAR